MHDEVQLLRSGRNRKAGVARFGCIPFAIYPCAAAGQGYKAIAPACVRCCAYIIIGVHRTRHCFRVHVFARVVCSQGASRHQSFKVGRYGRLSFGHVEGDDIESGRFGAVGVCHLVITVRCRVERRAVTSQVAVRVFTDAVDVEGGHACGVVIQFFFHRFPTVVGIQAHVSRDGVFRRVRVLPYVCHRVVPVLVRPVGLQPVAGVAHPFVFEVAVVVCQPYVEVVGGEHLLGIVLERLPLRALFPEAVASVAAFIAVAESGLEVIRLALVHLVAIHLVLEAVAYFVGDGRAYGLASAGVHPQCADYVIVTRSGSQPFFLVKQVDFHLVLVQARFALSRLGEA